MYDLGSDCNRVCDIILTFDPQSLYPQSLVRQGADWELGLGLVLEQ